MVKNKQNLWQMSLQYGGTIGGYICMAVSI